MSVLATFRNLKISVFIAALLLVAISLFSVNIGSDFKKIELSDTLHKQSEEILSFDVNAGEISKQLLKEHQLYMNVNFQKIQDLEDMDLVASIVVKTPDEVTFLRTLHAKLETLHAIATDYYTLNTSKYLTMVKSAQIALHKASKAYNSAVMANIKVKNDFALYLELATLIDILFMLIWYSYKLSVVKKDIKVILDVDTEDRNKTFKTVEFISIKRRMERRPMSSGGKNLLDPLTELLNEKGLLSEYAQRGSISKGYTFVTMLDIDGFKEMAQLHGKTFTDTVVKKVGFIINLEKKPSDIVGRVGEDQFIIITPRESQAEAFEAVERIREAVEKTKFKAGSEKITVTVSGGFAPKDKHEKIESAIGTANSLVKRAKVQGKNTIAKPQGFNSDFNSRM
jgi:diguanylate cyclase (GGDEF)-like protein